MEKERNEYKNIRIRRCLKIFKISFISLIILVMGIYHYISINNLTQQNSIQLDYLKQQLKNTEKDVLVYKTMYDATSKQIGTYKSERDEAISKYEYIKEQIKYSKINYGTPNRGSYNNQNLTEYPIITIDEMNQYIASISPTNSPFIGKGETFLKASKLTGLDPKYLYSHASVESGYGMSPIAVSKNNYYGIAAFNSDPDNAYHMGDDIDEGIINGAIWIKTNYTDKGYNTLNKMVYLGSYCLYDDGTPSDKWVDDISTIATKKGDLK